MASLFHSILSQLEEKINKKSNDKEKIALLISAFLHTTITANQITIQDTTLRITAPSTVKMALILNKDKIIQALQESEIKITTVQ